MAAKKLGSVSKSKSNYKLCDADGSEDVVPANIQKVNRDIKED